MMGLLWLMGILGIVVPLVARRYREREQHLIVDPEAFWHVQHREFNRHQRWGERRE